MSRFTIVEGNTNDKDNVRAIMVKGEKGDKGDNGEITYDDVVDNLTSTETQKPLSANQGKVLKDLVDNTYTKSETVEQISSALENEIINEGNLGANYYQHRTERKIVFEEYGQLVPQIRGVQGACTDGEYLYWCDWTSDNENSALVKSQFDGTEISRVTMTSQGHPNGITYCTKDSSLYVNFTSVGIDVYDVSDLSYVKTIPNNFYSSNTICWFEDEEMFLFKKGTTSAYYYLDYDILHNTNFYVGHSTRDWNMVYRFSTPNENSYVQQCDCMYGDVLYRCADRSRFNKTAQIQKFSCIGDYLGEIICEGLGTNEIESIIITDDYVYAIAYDNKKIYRASIIDTSGKSITYSYVQTNWASVLHKNGAKVSGYVNNSSTLPSTIEEAEENTYLLKHIPYATGNIQKIHFIIQTQGYRAIPLQFSELYVSGGNGIDGAMTYVGTNHDLFTIKIKGTFSENSSDGNTIFTLSSLYLDRYSKNTSGLLEHNNTFGSFRICAIVVEY